MHRPARHYSRRPWLLVVGAGTLVLVAGLAIAVGRGGAETPARPANVPQVSAVPAIHQDVMHEFNAVGTVESLQSVTIRPQIDGVLTEIAFREGETVKQGQLLATIDDRALQANLSAARAELTSQRAQLNAASADLKRYRDLSGRGVASRQTLEQQTSTSDRQAAAVQQAEANVQSAEVQLSYTRIFSPVTGRVGIRQVDSGNVVRTSDADGLVVVTQMDPISAVFSIPQSQLASLRDLLTHGVPVELEAIDRESGALLGKGHILAIDNMVQAGTGAVRVRAEFGNAAEKMWPGQFVAIRVPVGRSPAAVTVPAVALRPGLEGAYVYRLKGDTVSRVPVKAGYTSEQLAVISEGVSSGDMVVTDGFASLRDGAKVRLLATDGNSPANAMPAAATSEGPTNGTAGINR